MPITGWGQILHYRASVPFAIINYFNHLNKYFVNYK
jgi:hypothetical protein